MFSSNKPETIRTGQSYNIKLQLGESNQSLLLPKGAFYQNTGGQWIYVVNAAGDEAERRAIRIGKQNAKYYELLEGLEAGEKVITSNYSAFGDAEKIVIN